MALHISYDVRTGKLTSIVPGRNAFRTLIAGRQVCCYLGPQTGETRVCPSCKGHVEVKVHKCTIYEECTTDKKVADLACCNPANNCPRYKPLSSMVSPEEQAKKERMNIIHQRQMARFHPKIDKDFIAKHMNVTREELEAATASHDLTITDWRELMALADTNAKKGKAGILLDMSCSGCCGGGGSGSGSGSGGGGILTPCCPNLIPLTLYAHFSGGTGGCTCYDGINIPLNYDGLGAAGPYTWNGSATICGEFTEVDVTCDATTNQWVLGMDGCQLANAFPNSVQCDPFQLVWTNNGELNCCTGTVNLTVDTNA